ncbi:MAG TPA: DUF3501 family protein [Acidimicrobiales bacterium]
MPVVSPRKLAVADIADMRAYERERPAFLARIIELKRRRRVGVGPFVTLLFESRDTVRFQVQEMARVEKLITDEAIQTELDIYNPLIPEAGELSATLFVELTTDQLLREWLPKLVGIERAVVLRLAGGSEVRCVVEKQHESQLTRDDITSTVHYVRWELSAAQVDEFVSGPVTVAVDHPSYQHEHVLDADTVAELTGDLTA